MNAFILAGGNSRRFGINKALVKVGAETIIKGIVNSIKTIFNKITIIAEHTEDYEFLKLDVKADIISGAGPLGGIYTGLVYSSSFKNFFIACDMPDINCNLIKQMIIESDDVDVIVPKTTKGYEPLFAIYSKNCIKPILLKIRAGNFKIINFYQYVKVKEIACERIVNINTPADLRKYLKCLNAIVPKANNPTLRDLCP